LEQGLGEMPQVAVELIVAQQSRSREQCREALAALSAWLKTKEVVDGQD
jgi:hypothetical protein